MALFGDVLQHDSFWSDGVFGHSNNHLHVVQVWLSEPIVSFPIFGEHHPMKLQHSPFVGLQVVGKM